MAIVADVFTRLLDMSVTAGYLVVAVLLIRLLLKRAPRKAICALWGLVALRLALPFSIESVLSVLPSGQSAGFMTGLASMAQGLPSAGSGSTLPQAANGIGSQTGNIISQAATPESGLPRIWTHIASLIANPTQDVLQAAAAIWLIGMAILLAYAMISTVALRLRVATAIRLDRQIYRSDAIDTPFVLGLVRPRIYLPFSLDDSCAEHVIAHETAHIHRRDHWIKPLGFLLLTVHWFNPLVWLAYVLLCRDIELACDEQVLGRIGIDQKKAYAASLLTCSIRRSRIAMCPVAFGEVGVRQRVKNVLNYRKPAFWLTLVAIVASMAIAIGFLTDPIGEQRAIVDERLDKAVSAAILNYNNRKFASGVISGEGHRILLATKSSSSAGQLAAGDTRTVYALCGYATYEFPNGGPSMVGGNLLIPTVMTFTVDASGSYSLSNYQESREGTEMEPSIRRMFPKSIQNAVLHPSEDVRQDLLRQMEAYAVLYLQQVGRPDTDSNPAGEGLHENKIIALASVLSPKVAQDLLKQYRAYPDFLNTQSMTGAWETDEREGRYIYQVLWESSSSQSGKLIFRKSTWDGEKVVSNIEYQIDGDQYQLVERTRKLLAVFLTTEIDQAKSVVRAYYAALAAKDREAILKTLANSYQNVEDFFWYGQTAGTGGTELLDVRFNPDDPARISSDGNETLETLGDPANIIVLRVDFKVLQPATKGATAAPTMHKDWMVFLVRNSQNSPWLISHFGY